MFIFLILNLISLTLFEENCHEKCKTCNGYSLDSTNMKCLSCKINLYFLFNTSNCVDKDDYPSYYLNITDQILYPCSNFQSNCYECEHLSENIGQCLSCEKGYKYNDITNKCQKCNQDEFPVVISNFFNCKRSKVGKCDLYITNCLPKENSEIICPEEVPIFNRINESCHEYDCPKNGFKDGICSFLKKENEIKNNILYINWFNNEPKYLRYPSYNIDNSGYLLIELTGELGFSPDTHSIIKNNKRKLYFYDEEGRGYFDTINDIYEKTIETRQKNFRYISTSIALKISYAYYYFINFESYEGILEFYNMLTEEISTEKLIEIGNILNSDYSQSKTQLLELNEINQYLFGFFLKIKISGIYRNTLSYIVFSLDNSKKADIYSLNPVKYQNLLIDDETCNDFCFAQTKKGNILVSYIYNENYLLMHDFTYEKSFTFSTDIFKDAFFKLLVIKKEIIFICFYSSNDFSLNINIFDYDRINNENIYFLLNTQIKTEENEGRYKGKADIIFLSENKLVFLVKSFHGKRIIIYLINFFEDYAKYISLKFSIDLYEEKLSNLDNSYSLIFKYKDILGFQLENIEGENGFILFGYYNSTDPKQILNLKNDSINYEIVLKDYLNLQSNIFQYQIKCIKIIKSTDPSYSGIYLFSNITKDYIYEGDCLDINSKISLYFSYNGTIKSGNYFFKFAGVLEEAKYNIIEKNADGFFSNEENNEILDDYIKEYDKRRNTDIIGKVALLQINVLNDFKVSCDKKFNEFAIKNEYYPYNYIACGGGKFYDIINDNEITQFYPYENYFFDINKNFYIKCNKNCKTCSKEYNYTNQNCDSCYENHILRNGNCFEKPYCSYNYYYSDLKVICLNKEDHCLNNKPFEDKLTKECIEFCNISDFNVKCNPTNNPISIQNTINQIFENLANLNLQNKLIEKKEKYIINGHDVKFIFSTSDIEKKELYNSNKSTSIILDEKIEKEMKDYNFIYEDLPIPILKIESCQGDYNNVGLNYQFYNPLDLHETLNLNNIIYNDIQIRIPKTIGKYEFDLIENITNSGYDFFNLDDPFYNDICSIFSYYGQDMSLSERKNLKKNLDIELEGLCLKNCKFSYIDFKTARIICICKIGDYIYNPIDINFRRINSDEKKFNITLIDEFSKSSNINVIKCFRKIFSTEGLFKNYGFFIILGLLIGDISISIYSPLSKVEKRLNDFCGKVLTQIKEVYNVDTDNNKINFNEENKKPIKNKKNILQTNAEENIDYKKHKKIKNQSIKIFNENNKSKINFKSNRNKRKKNFIFNSNIHSKNTNSNLAINSQIEKSNKENKNENQLIENENNEDEEKIIKELKEKNNSEFYIYNLIKNIPLEKRKLYLSESELRFLPYKYAIKIDKRNRTDYFFSLIKENIKLLSACLKGKDYNIHLVKYSLFVFEIIFTLAINALFYNDEAIYEINQYEEESSLFKSNARVFYSTIITLFLNMIIMKLASTHNNIIKLRFYKDVKEVEKEIPKLISRLKIKYILFYVLQILIIIIFLYYITAFCAIYPNLQMNLFSDSLKSILISISYSVLLSLFSSLLRITSLKKKATLDKIDCFNCCCCCCCCCSKCDLASCCYYISYII